MGTHYMKMGGEPSLFFGHLDLIYIAHNLDTIFNVSVNSHPVIWYEEETASVSLLDVQVQIRVPPWKLSAALSEEPQTPQPPKGIVLRAKLSTLTAKEATSSDAPCILCLSCAKNKRGLEHQINVTM
ncbi:hypothetical protein GE061_005409 [Apolygus lucorum]|uniref:Uncharacterized protein n=1 Tax=Apolygus lucorum TaxID=248454 RepID=A0A8S9WW53_APOLU|nr:hypothetical protein GE061_005409 [Apolygus lucorum]